MQEIWKIIKGFPQYVVSNRGRVKNVSTGRILKPWIMDTGYAKIELWNNGDALRFRVHRLVAEAFISNLRNKPTVNHIDGNPLNNASENLEWATVEENLKWNDYLAFERVLSSLQIDPDVAKNLKAQAARTLSPTGSLPESTNAPVFLPGHLA